MHCFSGTVDQARRSLDAGFYLSFAGNLTYPAAKSIREAAAFAPADRILVETDAPFLAPIPHRGQRNEPAFVTHTAAALATLRNLTPTALADLTTQNFHTLFPTTPKHDLPAMALPCRHSIARCQSHHHEVSSQLINARLRPFLIQSQHPSKRQDKGVNRICDSPASLWTCTRSSPQG